MLLGKRLAELLRDENIFSMYVDKPTLWRLRKSGTNYLQWLSILITEDRVRICVEDREHCGRIVFESDNIRILHGGGYEACSNIYVRWSSRPCEGVDITGRIKSKLLKHVEELRRHILFVIDLSFWNEHTETEKRELVEQIVFTIKILRQYVHDSCLVLTSCCDEFIQYFEKTTRDMRHSVTIVKNNLRDFLKKVIKFRGKIAVLDPEGEFILSNVDVYSYNVFILGGIVDKERVDKYGTYRLYNMYRLWEFNIPRFRISLNGSTIGVPDRLNKIVNIVLEAKFLGQPLDLVVIRHQSKRDRIYRWIYEIQRFSRKVRSGSKITHVVSRELMDRLRERYPIDDKSIDRILRSLNVVIEG